MEKYVVFRLGREDFGIGIGKVVEILKAQKVRTLPELDDHLPGVITLRGDVVPLVDMRKRFGIVPSPGKERTVIVREGREKVGLIVDEVKGITGFLPGQISMPRVISEGLKTEYMTGLAKSGADVVILLRLEKILTAEEKALLKETIGKGRQ